MDKQQTVRTKSDSTRATYEDVLDAPEHMVAEIIDGVLYTHSRPLGEHAIAVSALLGWMNPTFGYGRGGPGGWWVVTDRELHLGEEVVVPDISGWRRERMPDPPTGTYSTLAPDWVCEVLSDSTRNKDLTIKPDLYAKAGIGHYWIVDPDVRMLEAFELNGTQWVSIGKLYDNAQVSLPPFEAIAFNLGDLWPYSWPPQTVHKETPHSSITEIESEITAAAK